MSGYIREKCAVENALEDLEQSIPCVPFKGIDKFYDIGGLLANPMALKQCVDLLIDHLGGMSDQFDSIGCFDARGFLFGPMLGVALEKKVFMLRKKGKMPRIKASLEYAKEYKSDHGSGVDTLCIQEGSVSEGDRVVLIDDLIATGGTASAGVKLVRHCGGYIHECAFVLELNKLEARKKLDCTVWSLLQK